MAGLSHFQLMMTDTDTLLRAAQVGDKDALVELQKRGEMSPPDRFRMGPNARDDGIPAPWRFGQNARDRTPVFALERGATTRDMARPAQLPMEQPPLPYMSAINQRPGEHPALGMNLANTAPSTDPITRIANGHDAAATVQAGMRAAEADAATTGPASSPVPPAGISAMVDEEVDPNGYGGMISSLINDLRSGVNGPDNNRRRALGEAGFAMAASGNPFFFGAVGQGGLAGLKAYREAEAADMETQIRAATLGQKELERFEDVRKHKADETHDAATLAESGRQHDQSLAETRTHNRALEKNAAYDSALRARGLDIQAQQLQVATEQFNRTQALAEKGFATEEEVKQAQVGLIKAQTEAQESLGLGRNTEVQIGQDGTVYKLDLKTDKATPFLDNDGKPIKGQPKAQTATSQKINFWTQAGKDPQWIADVLAGKRQPTQKEAMTAASYIASNASANILNPSEASAVYNQTYQDALTELSSPIAPTTTTPSTEAPTGTTPPASADAPLYKTPEEVKRDYKDGKLTKEQATEQIRKLQGQ